MADEGIKVTKDRLPEVLEAIRRMTEKDVLVGITSSTNTRDDTTAIGNAGILYIAEFGHDTHPHIPMRPVLGPALDGIRDRLAKVLKDGMSRAMQGDTGAVDEALETAGNMGRAAAVDRITSGDFTPIADSTARARMRRHNAGALAWEKYMKATLPAGEAAKLAENAQAAKKSMKAYLLPPLIDTGALRQALTYVIRPKGK